MGAAWAVVCTGFQSFGHQKGESDLGQAREMAYPTQGRTFDAATAKAQKIDLPLTLLVWPEVCNKCLRVAK